MAIVAKTGWKELRALLLIWGFLVGTGVATVIVLNLTGSRLINHIEYVEASRFARAQVLYMEAMRHAERLLQKAAELNRDVSTRKTLSPDDPDFKKAVELFGKAFALDPRDPYSRPLRPYYEILAHCYTAVGMDNWARKMGARAFLAEGNNRDASIYAGSVAADDPTDFEAWMLQADAQIRAGELENAEATLLKMEAAGAPPALVHELRGMIAEKRGQVAKAVAEYTLAIEKAPENIDLRKRLAGLLVGEKRREDALKVLREGLAYGGERDPNYLHRLGSLELVVGNAQDAVRYLERAARMEPSSGDIYFSLAQAYQALGKKARAYDALQEAIRRKPRLADQVLKPQE